MADFDGTTSQPPPPVVEHDSEASAVERPAERQPAQVISEAETRAQESEKAARRRSTVREKVSFGSTSQAEPATPSYHQQPSAAPAEAQTEPAPETSTETAASRRAGWWSRRFGGE